MKKAKRLYHSAIARICLEPYRTSTIKTSWRTMASSTKTLDSQGSRSNKSHQNTENCSRIDKINCWVTKNNLISTEPTKNNNMEKISNSGQMFQIKIIIFTKKDLMMLVLTTLRLRIDWLIPRDKTHFSRINWKLNMISKNNNKCHSVLKLDMPSKTPKTIRQRVNMQINGPTYMEKVHSNTQIIEETFHMMNMSMQGMSKIIRSNQMLREDQNFHLPDNPISLNTMTTVHSKSTWTSAIRREWLLHDWTQTLQTQQLYLSMQTN